MDADTRCFHVLLRCFRANRSILIDPRENLSNYIVNSFLQLITRMMRARGGMFPGSYAMLCYDLFSSGGLEIEIEQSCRLLTADLCCMLSLAFFHAVKVRII